MSMEVSRREFLKYTAAGSGILLLGMGGPTMAGRKSRVALASAEERKRGVSASIAALNYNPVKNKDVLIKPNFNTADAFPGSTHNDTLIALVEEIWKMGAKSVGLGERSYPLTKDVMEEKGVLPLMKKLDVKVLDFDDLGAKEWVEFKPKGSHWSDGFRIARPIVESECLVSTCCLKTHQYGGVFTMSLKLHVGVVPTRRNGYSYMSELHGSPHQRKMIAEINGPFKPALVVLDGIEAFVDEGPMTGKRAKANVFLASTDRVAIDAVGVAVLKSLGSNDAIMNRRIFEQEQIARAAELGLGASDPSEVELVAADEPSRPMSERISQILKNG
ncbi:MAG: DUF362 domain-containing protein [Desulfobacteraceae bacterium]|nr:MAG: DUF362 domain-containing protein [Desulfobacteraceae bacterium]